MGIFDHLADFNYTLFTMSPKDTEVVATMSTTEAPVEVGEEPAITFQKFGEMELPEDEEVDNAAYSVATEYVASYTPVQIGLSVATVVPVASIQRAARAARRAGAKNIDVVESRSEPSMLLSLVNAILNIIGLHLAPAVEDSSKPHLEPGTEPFTPEQEFGEMTLSD